MTSSRKTTCGWRGVGQKIYCAEGPRATSSCPSAKCKLGVRESRSAEGKVMFQYAVEQILGD
jgi:hypothetical protein